MGGYSSWQISWNPHSMHRRCDISAISRWHNATREQEKFNTVRYASQTNIYWQLFKRNKFIRLLPYISSLGFGNTLHFATSIGHLIAPAFESTGERSSDVEALSIQHVPLRLFSHGQIPASKSSGGKKKYRNSGWRGKTAIRNTSGDDRRIMAIIDITTTARRCWAAVLTQVRVRRRLPSAAAQDT